MNLYECHVTIDPVFDDRLDELKELVKPFRFKVADLIMKKSALSEELPSKKDTFMTGHGTDYDGLKTRMVGLIRDVKEENYSVRRYKIEEILLDSKTGDSLNLL